MPVTLINPFEVAATQEAAFVESWKRTAAVFADKPGYLDTRLHQSLDPAARFRFVNVAHWSSAEAWAEAMKAFPPQEGGVSGIKANPALYTPVQSGAIEARGATIEDEIRSMEEGLARAYQANDAGFLGRVLAEDYVVTDGPGTTSDKRKVLADHEGKRLHVGRFTFDEIRVQRLGPDAAMVTGQYTWDASYDGHPIPGAFRYLRVYVRGNAGWQVKAGQVTPSPPPRKR